MYQQIILDVAEFLTASKSTKDLIVVMVVELCCSNQAPVQAMVEH
jgi:hypothetical protein